MRQIIIFKRSSFKRIVHLICTKCDVIRSSLSTAYNRNHSASSLCHLSEILCRSVELELNFFESETYKIIFHIVLGEFHITSRNKKILHDIRQNNGRKSKSIFTNYQLPIWVASFIWTSYLNLVLFEPHTDQVVSGKILGISQPCEQLFNEQIRTGISNR